MEWPNLLDGRFAGNIQQWHEENNQGAQPDEGGPQRPS